MTIVGIVIDRWAIFSCQAEPDPQALRDLVAFALLAALPGVGIVIADDLFGFWIPLQRSAESHGDVVSGLLA